MSKWQETDPKQRNHYANLRTESDLIDEASKETFPTSDPPGWTLGSNFEADAAMNNQITQILHREHSAIRNVIQSFKLLIDGIENGKEVEMNVLNNYLDFFMHFVDECHQVKEEIIFHDLTNGDTYPSDYMLNNLLEEHEVGKELALKLKTIIESYSADPVTAKKHLIHTLNSLYNLYINHIAKEEEYVLPTIHYILDESELDYLQNSFEKIDNKLQKKYLSYLQFAENLNPTHE